MYTLQVLIESDSGVGPYSETKFVANCSFKNDEWYKTKSIPTIVGNSIVHKDDTRKVKDWYHTSMADCKVTIVSFTIQKNYYDI